jgi:hypothetical protein
MLGALRPSDGVSLNLDGAENTALYLIEWMGCRTWPYCQKQIKGI